MYPGFAKSILRQLAETEFETILPQYRPLTKETGISAAAKNLSPLLYLVSIVNLAVQPYEPYLDRIKPMTDSLEKQLEAQRCNHLVAVHIFVEDKRREGFRPELLAWLDSQETIPDAPVLHVFWAVNTQSKEFIAGKNQPDKILYLREVIEKAFSQQARIDMESEPFFNMQTGAFNPALMPKPTKRHLLTYLLILLNVFVFLVSFGSGQIYTLLDMFANSPEMVLEHGQFYRLVTCMFFHLSLSHLVSNSIILFVAGGIYEDFAGKKRFLCTYFGGGVLASLFSVFLTQSSSAGASGAIYSVLGGLLITTFFKRKSLGGVSYYTLLVLILMGLISGFIFSSVDNFAHLGGLIGGMLLNLMFHDLDKRLEKEEEENTDESSENQT